MRHPMNKKVCHHTENELTYRCEYITNYSLIYLKITVYITRYTFTDEYIGMDTISKYILINKFTI